MKTLQTKLYEILKLAQDLEHDYAVEHLQNDDDEKEEELQTNIDTLGFVVGRLLECIDEINL